MSTTHALQPVESAALASSNASLPSIAEIRQRMTWLAEFRPVLLEYVQRHMDPKRHMYTFDNNRYTPMDPGKLAEMMATGQKPALNQDGIHNLMSLYDCYPDEPTIHETREEEHYTCRATVRLISFRSGLPMGAGTGSCSTRESKYAYRWVSERDVPRGMDKTALKTRTFEGRSGSYVRYRLANEDVADVEATVLQMAVKRAKSSAVKALPLVSEMFAAVGDPDEDKRAEDEARQELLQPIGTWLKGIKGAAARARAILAVFTEPINPNDIAKLDEDRLAIAGQVIAIGTRQGVIWESPALVEDLKQVLRTSAVQSSAHLFGDRQGATPSQPAHETPAHTAEDAPQATIPAEDNAGIVLETGGPGTPSGTPPAPVNESASRTPVQDAPKIAREGGKNPRSGGRQGVDTPERAGEAARGLPDDFAFETLRAHQANPALPQAVLERIAALLSPLAPGSAAEVQALASQVLDALDSADADEA